MITAGTLALLAIAFVVGSDTAETPLDWPSARQLKLVAIVSLAFAAYIGLAHTLGFLLSTWLTLAIVTRVASEPGMVVSIVWPGLLAVASTMLFRAVGTSLPTGFLGY